MGIFSSKPTDEALETEPENTVAQQDLLASVLKAPSRVEMKLWNSDVYQPSEHVAYKVKYYLSDLQLNKGILLLSLAEWHELVNLLESDDHSTEFISSWMPKIQIKGDLIKLRGTNTSTMLRQQFAQPFAAAIRKEIDSGVLALPKIAEPNVQPAQPAEMPDLVEAK